MCMWCMSEWTETDVFLVVNFEDNFTSPVGLRGIMRIRWCDIHVYG